MEDNKINSYLTSDDRKLFLNAMDIYDLSTIRFLYTNSDPDYIVLMNLDMIANTDTDYDMFGITMILDKDIYTVNSKVNDIPLFEYFKNDTKHNNNKIIRYLRSFIVANNIDDYYQYDKSKINDIYDVLTIEKDDNKKLLKESTN